MEIFDFSKIFQILKEKRKISQLEKSLTISLFV